jgi:hypothetical protein
MILPSVVTFYKDNKEVRRLFVNCGWFCNPETIKNGIKITLKMNKKFDWDIAEAYNVKFNKKDFN